MFFSVQLILLSIIPPVFIHVTVSGNISFYFYGWVMSLVAQRVKRLPAMQETWVQSLGQEDPLEKEMATHSSTLAWKILWTEKPGRLQSMGSQRVGHDWVTSLSFTFFLIGIKTLWISLWIFILHHSIYYLFFFGILIICIFYLFMLASTVNFNLALIAFILFFLVEVWVISSDLSSTLLALQLSNLWSSSLTF